MLRNKAYAITFQGNSNSMSAWVAVITWQESDSKMPSCGTSLPLDHSSLELSLQEEVIWDPGPELTPQWTGDLGVRVKPDRTCPAVGRDGVPKGKANSSPVLRRW